MTDCSGTGWHAASGDPAGGSGGRSILSAWSGKQVELSISYASDWAAEGLRCSSTISTRPARSDAGFETGLYGWRVAGLRPGSRHNLTDWADHGDVGFTAAAAVETSPPDARYRRCIGVSRSK